jgi:DNA-binding CsgD family transcriptional regulator
LRLGMIPLSSMENLTTYLERLTNAASVEELWAMHVVRMGQYGFDRLIYGYTRYRSGNTFGDPQDWVVLTNHPPQYMDHFINDGLYFHAPMMRWALENNGACSWRWIEDHADRLTPSERKVMEFNRRMGVTAGYTISFRAMSSRTKGAMALTAPNGTPQYKVDQVWAEHGTEILVANNVAHLKILTLPYSGTRHLTKRQREVLQWVGDGKTTQDIALLMGLTAATVEKHLRLAREALDVDTTAQAVLKVAFQNQIFVLDA